MPRAPFNAFTFPYRKNTENELEYALLKRSDAGFWQGTCGGGEDDEAPLEAAKREAFEEAGISLNSPFIQLDTFNFIRANNFKDSHLWGEDVYVIPQYYFGVLIDMEKLILSQEHLEFRWLTYKKADNLLKFDGDKTALWELNQRLKGLGPRG